MQPFVNAKPIFIKNRRESVNFQAGFKCVFSADAGKKYLLRITGATLYSIWLNGEFVFYGPAKAPHGYLRYDEIELDASEGENTLCVCLAGYNCPSFYTMNIKSFLQAEVFEDGIPICSTGSNFKAISLDGLRERKAYRYSYQRAFNEVWNLDNADPVTNWQSVDFEGEPLNTYTYDEQLIPRSFANPTFDTVECGKVLRHGRFRKKDDFKMGAKRHVSNLNCGIVGYPEDEIKSKIMHEIYGRYFPDNLTNLDCNRYTTYDFERIYAGFILSDIVAEEDSEVYLIFSETLKDGMPDSRIDNVDTQNIVKYTLKKSEKPYRLQSFEAYSFRYLSVLVSKGKVSVGRIGVRKYEYPLTENTKFTCADGELLRIFDAAKATFCQNTVDCFMDCPGRERAGWLCDSYFTSQAEQIFAGGASAEEPFLKNFIMAKDIPDMDTALLPMCYPGENNGVIMQWIMWYILEFEGYLKRKADNKDYFKNYCYDFLSYLSNLENGDGLLERCNGWNFIEWSDANDFVEEADVSYPTNMLYYAVLQAMGRIYGDGECTAKAERIKKTIIQKSFDGKYFCDGALLENGKYANMPNTSEACQYYAAFCGVADFGSEEFSAFYDNLLNNLGYRRKLKGEMPEVAYASVFIGYTLRMMFLLKIKDYDRLIDEVKELYGHMAEHTMTLWEHDEPVASCNHGLSSVAGVLIIKALCGIWEIDEANKKIVMTENYYNEKCDITIGLESGTLHVTNDGTKRCVDIPDGYTAETV